jgi:hypothetical protein
MKVKATLIGFSAILMWSLLALFTAASGTMPPFQLSAICFSIGSIPGLVVLALKPERLALSASSPQKSGSSALPACSAIISCISRHFGTPLRSRPG